MKRPLFRGYKRTKIESYEEMLINLKTSDLHRMYQRFLFRKAKGNYRITSRAVEIITHVIMARYERKVS